MAQSPPPRTLHDLVVYHGAHQLRGSNSRKHISAISNFLDACTVNQKVTELQVAIRTGRDYPKGESKQLLEKYTKKWGHPTFKRLEVGGAVQQTAHCWAPEGESIENLLSEITAENSTTKSLLPTISIELSVEFEFMNIESKGSLPHQSWSPDNYRDDEFYAPHGFSKLWAYLGNRSTLGCLLSLPFSATDPSFVRYLNFLQDHFPTRLSMRSSWWHWWCVTKAGNKHYRRSAISALGGKEGLLTALSTANARKRA